MNDWIWVSRDKHEMAQRRARVLLNVASSDVSAFQIGGWGEVDLKNGMSKYQINKDRLMV